MGGGPFTARRGAGWLYLATVVDGFSRGVVGWAMGDRPVPELVVDAATMAVRRPAWGRIDPPLRPWGTVHLAGIHPPLGGPGHRRIDGFHG